MMKREFKKDGLASGEEGRGRDEGGDGIRSPRKEDANERVLCVLVGELVEALEHLRRGG